MNYHHAMALAAFDDDECCEFCGYPAASGHPSDCAYWLPVSPFLTVERDSAIDHDVHS